MKSAREAVLEKKYVAQAMNIVLDDRATMVFETIETKKKEKLLQKLYRSLEKFQATLYPKNVRKVDNSYVIKLDPNYRVIFNYNSKKKKIIISDIINKRTIDYFIKQIDENEKIPNN